MSNNIPAFSSLVKFSTPTLVSVAGGKKQTKDKKKELPPVEKGGKKEKDTDRRTEEILNKIIPPKEYVLENGQLWVQTVLCTPATRTEVITLQDELDKRLSQRNARETGICPIREELYEQCFDELIRQITIDCKERGLLLVQVRDEIVMQLNSYKTLYESSIAYGMRKMIESEQKKTDMANKISHLEKECSELSKYVEEIEKRIVTTKQTETEKLEKENKDHLEDIGKIKESNNLIKEDLEKILSGKIK